MAVDRLLPTEEARDLLELTREIADKELATRVEEHERARDLPRGRCSPPSARPDCWARPTRRSAAAAGSRTRCTCRCSRSSAMRWAAVAVAVSVHGLSCHPLAAFGTDGAEGAVAAGACSPATRSAATASPSRRPDPTPPH